MRSEREEQAPVALFHNFYQQPGGEDEVFRAEGSLLEAHGHRVVRYSLANATVTTMSRAALLRATVWNGDVYRAVRRLLREEAPRVAHFHNTFPLISPAAYYAARDEGVPVVQTLHNYRLICPNAQLFRDSAPCTDCVGKRIAWPGVVHACYRQSRSATAAAASMLAIHHGLGTWARVVDSYIALTEFARARFVEGGIPAARIVVKPNFLAEDPAVGDHAGGFALSVGRLSREKGVETLLTAWERLRHPFPLKIVGSGPFEAERRESPPSVEWLGQVSKARVMGLMKDATFLVFASEMYEGFPVTLLEAFATGLPVIASGHGSMAEVVPEGVAGLLFRPADVDDLVQKVEWALGHGEEMARLGYGGRRAFEAHYTGQRNYEALMRIYASASERTERTGAHN